MRTRGKAIRETLWLPRGEFIDHLFPRGTREKEFGPFVTGSATVRLLSLQMTLKATARQKNSHSPRCFDIEAYASMGLRNKKERQTEKRDAQRQYVVIGTLAPIIIECLFLCSDWGSGPERGDVRLNQG